MRAIDADKIMADIATAERSTPKEYTLLSIARYISIQPTIEAEPIRHGKWIHTGFMEVKCSDCGNVFHELEDTNYCPSCGAKMIPTIPKEIIDAVLGEDEVDDEVN